MKESFKIALGVFGGLVAAFACIACFFVATSLGGVAAIGALFAAPATAPLPTLSWETSAPTQSPKGHIAKCDDIGLDIVSYTTPSVCPTGSGGAAEGARFVVVQVSAANTSADVIGLPLIDFRIDEYEAGLGASGECRYDAQSFGNACFSSDGKLFPGVTCQGWELFEVPAAFDVREATLHASFNDPISRVSCEAQWPLVPPK